MNEQELMDTARTVVGDDEVVFSKPVRLDLVVPGP